LRDGYLLNESETFRVASPALPEARDAMALPEAHDGTVSHMVFREIHSNKRRPALCARLFLGGAGKKTERLNTELQFSSF
jgi:hypothetical protein